MSYFYYEGEVGHGDDDPKCRSPTPEELSGVRAIVGGNRTAHQKDRGCERMSAMDFTTIANELYALTPQEFTAARNARAVQARKEGRTDADKELAESIRRLPRPSASAWIVNMLVRHKSDEIQQVLALGASLREAQEELNRNALTELTRQRRKLVNAVTAQALELADRLGQPANASAEREVEQTLQAAMADPDAAIALQSGRLVRALASVGFEPVDLEEAVAAPETSIRAPKADAGERHPPAPGQSARREREREEAQRAVAEAERDVHESMAELEALVRRASDSERRLDELTTQLDELMEQVENIETEIGGAEREIRAVDHDRSKADRSAERALRNTARARERLDRLTDEA